MFSTHRRRLMGWVLLYVCAAAFILSIVATVVSTRQIANEVRSTQLEGTPTGKKLLRSAETIEDCTQTSGDCYKRNQENTAKAVADLTGNLTRVVVLASACSSDLPGGLTIREREVAIQNCIIGRLSQEAP